MNNLFIICNKFYIYAKYSVARFVFPDKLP